MRRTTKRRVATGLALTGVAAVAGYALFPRPRLRHWGATKPEVGSSLPGDDRVSRPNYVSTRAVTIHAPASDVWPWLVQMGYHRGGLYSYDWLDRLFGYLDRPSADEVLPEHQALQVGDTVPLGKGPAWPVVQLEPERTLVLEPIAGVVTWAFSLVPVDPGTTRLVTRVRLHVPRTTKDRVMMTAMDPAAFFMTRRMLLGIKRRAEALAHHNGKSDPIGSDDLPS
jgi:hypothetical protein